MNSMSSPLAAAIANLCSPDSSVRLSGAGEIFERGRTAAEGAVAAWRTDAELVALLGSEPAITVGLAVKRETFARIREANGSARLANVPPDQDAEEFELHFPHGISLDVLTTRDPAGQGAIAKFLSRFGEGVQQVEFLCNNVDRAMQILREKFGIEPIYPQTRAGADHTRVNFFLLSVPSGKILVELVQPASTL